MDDMATHPTEPGLYWVRTAEGWTVVELEHSHEYDWGSEAMPRPIVHVWRVVELGSELVGKAGSARYILEWGAKLEHEPKRYEAAEARIAGLEARLLDMTDRYHEASNETDLLRDSISHAPAYANAPSIARAIVAETRIAELEERYEMLAQDHAGALADRRNMATAVAAERERILTALDKLVSKITRHGSIRIRAFIADMRKEPF